MNINFMYDASVASAPAGFQTALATVAQAASLYFTNSITINIEVGWGEFAGKPLSVNELGMTDAATLISGSIGLTYAQLKTELMQHASSIDDVIAITNMPASDPSGGGLIYVSSSQQKAWGLLPANAPGIDGAIGFNAMPSTFDFNPNDGISPGLYDFVGTALHEITHVVGRVLGLQFGVKDLMDLFDYSSPGHLATSQPGYFSIDGKTLLNYFSTSGDLADWSGTAGADANNAFVSPGHANPFTLTDFGETGVLGFNLNLPSANNVVLPALATYQSMYGALPSSSELWNLKVFDAAHSLYGQNIGVLDASVYMHEALGMAMASGSDTGSTAFKGTWGPQAISSDATFVAQAYAHVFGTQGNQAQIQHFVDQVNYFEHIYTASGAFGSADNIDLLARGAVYGQMVGIEAEIHPQANLIGVVDLV